MLFNYNFGTKVYFGKDCVKDNINVFGKAGKRAFIVTGKDSGKLSGALDDVIYVLQQCSIDYIVYEGIENNPSTENVMDAAFAARNFDADFVIGIGGGSPLDASKAVAVLAKNDIEPQGLFGNVYDKKPLTIIAIPTTAGTGSEVTQYSILTRKDLQTKMSFGNEDTFPKAALLDSRYTLSMSYETTVNTAVDALSHAMEGYLSKRSMPVSDILAVEAMGIFGGCIDNLINNTISLDDREKLLYMSMLAGMVIAQTGTTIIHGLGYSLTYFKGIPHGKANAFFMREYLKYNYDTVSEKIKNVLNLLKVGSIDQFGEKIDKLISGRVDLDKSEIKMYASLAMGQRSTLFNARTVKEEDLIDILEKSFPIL